MDMYSQGQMDALAQLGLVKTSAGAPAMFMGGKSLVQRAMPTVKRWGRGLSNFAIGSPRQFGREMMSGKGFAPGSLLRQSMAAPKLWEKALFYGLPAYEAGSIALDKEPDKARRIGASVGGAAMGLATWKPLGMLGSMAAMPVGSYVGKRLGGMVSGKPAMQPQAQPQQQYPGYQMSPAQMAIGVGRPMASYMAGGGGQ
jgi:hypothetical protein